MDWRDDRQRRTGIPFILAVSQGWKQPDGVADSPRATRQRPRPEGHWLTPIAPTSQYIPIVITNLACPCGVARGSLGARFSDSFRVLSASAISPAAAGADGGAELPQRQADTACAFGVRWDKPLTAAR